MVHTTHGGDNICTSLSADSCGESEYLLTGDTGAAAPKTSDPPQVLISPAIVSQMREKRRQLEALREMIAEREGRNDG